METISKLGFKDVIICLYPVKLAHRVRQVKLTGLEAIDLNLAHVNVRFHVDLIRACWNLLVREEDVCSELPNRLRLVLNSETDE